MRWVCLCLCVATAAVYLKRRGLAHRAPGPRRRRHRPRRLSSRPTRRCCWRRRRALPTWRRAAGGVPGVPSADGGRGRRCHAGRTARSTSGWLRLRWAARPAPGPCDGVVEASLPIAIGGGEVLVMRGVAGRALATEHPDRRGATLDVVDLASGKLRTIHAMAGYLLYVAGVRGREAVVYRVALDGADVVAIDLDNGQRGR